MSAERRFFPVGGQDGPGPFLGESGLPLTPAGRVRVAATLEAAPGVFVAGDAAGVALPGGFVRMGVQAALTQGWHAAGNLLRGLRGEPLQPYRWLDPGWVVPLANRRGAGFILGLPLFGRLPAFLHYAMSVFRSVGLDTRRHLFRHLLGGR
ncbi:MAG: hypothetical protein GX442_08800 [Candidatus Riflebacteria bacterium]|nr:hypothetical protein [Candidatus Riflebacteria bacterium]